MPSPSRSVPLLVSLLCSILPAAAGPVDSAIVAAMKVAEAPNYTWRTDVTDDVRSYEITGTTERATDFSLVTMPLPSAAAGSGGTRRGGPGGGPRGGARGTSGAVSTVVFKGADNYVVQVDEAWRKPDEVGADDRSAMRRSGPYGGPPGSGPVGGPGRRRRGPGGAGEGDAAGGYSNLQTTLSRPHEEIGVIVGGATEWKVEGDMVSGTLPETTAMLLLVHPGQKDIEPKRAAGTFRFWIQQGVLVKYETKLEGVLVVNGREVAVHQTATTTFSQVGTTRVDVPAEAKRKLAGGL